MKNYFYILLILSIFSCSSDDDSIEIKDKTSKIELENITASSVNAKWTISEDDKLDGSLFALYLNDDLIDDEISSNEYFIENLTPSTQYSVKINYENTNNNLVTLQEDFTTSATGKLLLTKYTLLHSSGGSDSINLNYNENEQLTQKLFPTAVTSPISSNYYYNDNNKLSHLSSSPFLNEVSFNYSSNQINDITILEGDSDVYKKFYYSNFTNNSYNVIQTLNNSMDGSEDFINEKNIDYTLNSDDCLSTLKITDLNTQEINNLTFTYSNVGNLIKMDFDGNILNIEYDNSNNFHTYDAFLLDSRIYNFKDSGGLLFLNDEFIQIIKYLPIFINKNVNNPTKYILNGNLVRTFDYEYNDLNYPSKITIQEVDSSITYPEIELQYINSKNL